MEVLLEELGAYIFAALLIGVVFLLYIRRLKRVNRETASKIQKAMETGLYEPVSLHPYVDHDICIGTSACIDACPEKDILGLSKGKAVTVNTSRCVGHGACFHACPVQAISLLIGTEKRGVDLPHVNQEFETNIPLLYIAGELGGMGLIKNAVEQGKQAIDYLTKKIKKDHHTDADVIIVGAGPAGIGATLNAVKNGLRYITLEQDTIGGTVASFPRAKLVMTSPMELPMHGKVKLTETSKSELISLWQDLIQKYQIRINEQEKVEEIKKIDDLFHVKTSKGQYRSSAVLLAIGRRGTPRKLGCTGEQLDKVYYRLLEPELIKNQEILVVGGGDSAIESALLLADEGNHVSLSYRSETFSRLKPQNSEKISAAAKNGTVQLLMNTTVREITKDSVILIYNSSGAAQTIKNDLVYVFAGGELPTSFLEKIGVQITKKFGEAILRH
ncbi:MAG: NAD(P)-binding domain-containing protein [Ignavibacteriaceae bacterium]|nr:NAD(P)-binding domain-containing protein [Ignavibacteriaceae bacterium]